LVLSDGTLHPGLLSQLTRKGLSVLRESASNEEFETTFAELKKGSDSRGQERYLDSISSFRAGAIRFIDGRRLAGVYGTPVDGRPHHADVMAPRLAGLDAERRRKKLTEVMSEGRISIDEFRGGTFLRHARPQLRA
jgi:hypothetical protein